MARLWARLAMRNPDLFHIEIRALFRALSDGASVIFKSRSDGRILLAVNELTPDTIIAVARIADEKVGLDKIKYEIIYDKK